MLLSTSGYNFHYVIVIEQSFMPKFNKFNESAAKNVLIYASSWQALIITIVREIND